MCDSLYQKAYEKKIGRATLNIQEAVAGRSVICRLIYRAGFYGVDESGSLKVLFRIVSDYEEFQFTDSDKPNYVSISCSNKKVRCKVAAPSGGIFGKVHTRPWSRGFIIHVAGSYLNKEDEVFIDFHHWNIQTFYEKTFEFRVLVDPFATAKYLLVPSSPVIELRAGAPAKLVVLAPTTVQAGERFRVFARLEDRFGNPCMDIDAVFSLHERKNQVSLQKTVRFRKGRAVISVVSKRVGILVFFGKFKNLSAVSNPVLVQRRLRLRQFWADLHAQSEETVGTGSVYDYFHFARDYGFVDVASHQANDFQISNETWRKINDSAERYQKQKQFVAFPGYEWSGNTLNGGDHNVIYRKQNMPLYRSSHALIDDFSDVATDAPTIRDLLKKFQKLSPRDVMVIAHVGGRWADVTYPAGDDHLRKFVEVHSCWGTFEWMLQDAFSAGKRVGVVANSDGHTGRPGAEHPGTLHFTTYGGYTCILARSLTRKDIFDALLARHTYATTGARMFLDVRVFYRNRELGMMGDRLKKQRGGLELWVKALGSGPIDRIEVWNRDRIVFNFYPDMPKQSRCFIKTAWSGSSQRGRANNILWSGQLKVQGNRILERTLEKFHFYGRYNTVDVGRSFIHWQGRTTGGVQGIIFGLEKFSGTIALLLNNRRFLWNVSDIQQQPIIVPMGGLDAKVELCRVSPPDSQPLFFEFHYRLKEFLSGDNPLFVKVIQRDGEMAWSSPIYLVD